ncbi:MAG: hypothetical protein E6R04_03480 [Spirochaetes bacterium]|nr:MAG: hypothetical protein E6R04_03480 [Spirochaetota bacterium]
MVNAPDWFLAPMLCKTTQRETLDTHGKWDGYIAEPKHDGTRCLAVRFAGESVRLFSRSGQDYTDHVPHLVNELNAWMPSDEDAIVDGELAIISDTFDLGGKRVPVTDFNKTMRVMGSGAEKARDRQKEFGKNITFIIYDIPQWNGRDLTGEHFTDRRKTLKHSFTFGSEHLFLNPQFTDPTRFGELFDTLVEHDVEGIIIKNATSLYVFEGRPNSTWFKVKAAVTMDMVVTGFTDGTGKYEGMIGALEFGRYTDDGVVYVGRCSGMTDALRKEMSDDRDSFIGRVVEIKSNELCGSKEYRSPRHPQFVCFRTDKLPEQCLGEELKQDKDA